MPIVLSNIKAHDKKQHSPTYFSSKLTGMGKSTGTLSADKDPKYLEKDAALEPADQSKTKKNSPEKAKKYTNGPYTIAHIPVFVTNVDILSHIKTKPTPDTKEMCHLGTITHPGGSAHEIYLDLEVYGFIFTEKAKNGHEPASKELTTSYLLHTYFINPSNPATTAMVCENIDHLSNGYHQFNTALTLNPFKEINALLGTIENFVNMGATFTQDQDVFEFFDNISLYNLTQKQVVLWKETIPAHLDIIAQNLANSGDILEMIDQVAYLETYQVTLDNYKAIYEILKKYYSPEDVKLICKHNLNLLLANTLNSLQDSKDQLIKPPSSVGKNVTLPDYFSQEQIAAITSDEPLILVQSGAGCGKTSVILSRVDYLQQCGVDPKDITVISFTNAAANNFINRNPGIKSMTIASMIHTIYEKNFPTHELGNLDTIANAIEIHYKTDPVAIDFKKRIISLSKNDKDSFTLTNNFIENNYEAVIEILNTIRQTTLELEIIICYQQIDHLIEPDEVTSKFLIIDEVQDNSIFEFIYALRYTDKHKQSLYMVGDASQTLYEFRASNPKALNMLEKSEVFATYQLQTNYRSNQEILDFANVALDTIEANQYAQIQLKANSLSPVTSESFKDKINLHYESVAKIAELPERLPSIFMKKIKPYVDEKLSKDEKVAFIAYTRHHIYNIENIIKTLYSDKNIVNLTPDKNYNQTIFSDFILKLWNTVKFSPSASIIHAIMDAIMGNLDFLVASKEKSAERTKDMLMKWSAECGQSINNWQAMFMRKQITQDEFIKLVQDCMLAYEIKNNAIRQSVIARRNEENKNQRLVDNADIIISTIHSAKGLEFDNVVILYQGATDMNQEKQRMYYVAFTRAKHSEYILAFGNEKKPKIEADYEYIIEKLTQKDDLIKRADELGDSITVITGIDEDGNPIETKINPSTPIDHQNQQDSDQDDAQI